MIPELGNFSLILAFALSCFLFFIPLIGIYRADVVLINSARPLARGVCLFSIMAFLMLIYCFIVNDFSVLYVASNSSKELPFFYRACAAWGAHEGSILLWVTILSVWMVAVAQFSKKMPDDFVACVLAVLGFVAAGFFLFIVTTSDPFLRLLPVFPANGRDLNPLLQDPGFVFHPPMLYMGYVGFSVAFAFAIASLILGRLDQEWAKWTRAWTMASWSCLTVGITLGSWWAYRELGWGGWWAWDPVENASFLPWLVGTALIHSLMVTQKRNSFKAWTILLSIVAFSLSLLGTFLVRSGVLMSVHAFAVDPKRGLFILMFLMIVIGASLSLYGWRAFDIQSRQEFSLTSREGMLLSNNVLLFVIMITVLIGTLYPLIIQVMNLGKLSVGAPYFNKVVTPLFLPLLFLMGVVNFTQWQNTSINVLFQKMKWQLLSCVTSALLLPVIITGKFSLFVAIGFGLSLWIMQSTLLEWLRNSRINKAMVVAHIGIALTVMGITFSEHYSIERDVRMAPGEVVSLGQYDVKYQKQLSLRADNYDGAQVIFDLQKNQQTIAQLASQKRIFTIAKMPMSHAAIDVSWWRDVYIALGEPLDGDAWAIRMYLKPFVRFIWLGGFFMLFAGLLFFVRIRKEWK